MRADGSPYRRQFLITTVLVTALAGFLLVTSIGGVIEDLRARDHEAAQEAELRARILGDNAVRTFSEVQKTLLASMTATTPEQLAVVISATPSVRSVAHFDAAGRLVIRTNSQSLTETAIGTQRFFGALRAGRKFSLVVLDRPGLRAGMPAAAARMETPSGAFAGVALAEIAIEETVTLYRYAARGGSIALLGFADRVIVGWPPAPDGNLWTGRASTDIPGLSDLTNQPRMHVAAAQRPSFGGAVLVGVPRPPVGLWTVVRQPTVVMALLATLVAISLLMVLNRLAHRHDAANVALRASQDQAANQLAELEALYNTALVGLAYVDRDLKFRRINAHLARINGVPQQAHIGRRLRDILPAIGDAVEPYYRRVVETGERIVEQEIRGITPADPNIVHTWLANYHPIRNASGEIVGVNAMVQDITDRKRAEAALRESEQRFRIAAECISDLIYEWNVRTGEIHWYGDIDSHLGYAPGEVLRTYRGWEALIHPDDRARVRQEVADHLAVGGEAVTEYRVLMRDGSEQIWSDRGRVVADAAGAPLLLIGAVADITERRRSVATERRLLDAIEHMSEGLALWDAEDRLVFCNERYRVLSGNAGPLLTPGIKFDEFLRSSMKDRLLDEAIGNEEKWLADRLYAHRHPSGPIDTQREGRWLRVYEHLLPNGGVIVALNDIHTLKLQEEQLRQAQKMEAVGHLTGGVAHDFNNLLAVILGNLELLEERTQAGTPERDMLAAALRASRRGAEMTQRLLAFARRQPLSPQITDLKLLVDELVPMLRRTLGETIEIVNSAEPKLGQVRADRGQLENVLINLCVNARDAMPRGGALSIDLRNVVLDDSYSDVQEEVRPGPYVMMAVSDTGTGMSEDTKRRAFEPFFTTKEVGKGSGLGLSTAYGFVKQSGGHITLYSELGFGTTVRLYFPRAEGEQPSAQTAPSPEIVSSPGHETILLVEDDADVRRLAATLLAGLGYQVLEAASGDAALDLLDRSGPIDLLLTDVILPGGMLGPTLAAEVEQRRPGTRVLYMSGYTEDALIHGGRLDEGVELISKPFRKSELAARIRQILRGGREG